MYNYQGCEFDHRWIQEVAGNMLGMNASWKCFYARPCGPCDPDSKRMICAGFTPAWPKRVWKYDSTIEIKIASPKQNGFSFMLSLNLFPQRSHPMFYIQGFFCSFLLDSAHCLKENRIFVFRHGFRISVTYAEASGCALGTNLLCFSCIIILLN